MLTVDSYLIAVGTYTEAMPHVQGQGQGIHLLRLDASTATFHECNLYAATRNPSYLCATPDRLYSVNEHGTNAGLDVFAIEYDPPSLRRLKHIDLPGIDPCHISVNPAAAQLYISNYGSGDLLCYALNAQGLPQEAPRILQRQGSGPYAGRQEAPHLHYAMASPDGTALYCCDLGTDTVFCHAARPEGLSASPLWTLQTQPGSGPRHLALNADGSRFAVIEELSNTVALYALDEAKTCPQLLIRTRTLPDDWHASSSAAAIRLHPNGVYLYAANRGHDSIAVYRMHHQAPWLERLGFIPTQGRTPRDIVLTSDGKFLLIAAQDDHFVRALRIDATTGLPQSQGAAFSLRSPACLCPLSYPTKGPLS